MGPLLLLECRPADEVAFTRREAHGEGRQRAAEDRDLPAFLVDAQLVSVQRQAALEPQCVACAEAHRRGPGAHQRAPELLPVLGRHEELEGDRLAGVARPGEASLDAATVGQQQGGEPELVAQRLGHASAHHEGGEDVARRAALQGDHGDLVGPVGHLRVRELREVRTEVLPVLVPVGGVHDQQVLAGDEVVEVRVVHRAAGLGRHHRVLRLQRIESLGVAGEHMLQERDGAGAAEHEAAHVRDVEETASAPRREVLRDDAGGVLHRHLPAAEVDHLRAGGDVLVVEGRARQLVASGGDVHRAHAFSRPSPSRMRSVLMPE